MMRRRTFLELFFKLWGYCVLTATPSFAARINGIRLGKQGENSVRIVVDLRRICMSVSVIAVVAACAGIACAENAGERQCRNQK